MHPNNITRINHSISGLLAGVQFTSFRHSLKYGAVCPYYPPFSLHQSNPLPIRSFQPVNPVSLSPQKKTIKNSAMIEEAHGGNSNDN